MTEAELHIGTVRTVAPQRREVRIGMEPRYVGTAKALTWCEFTLRTGAHRRFKVATARNAGKDVVVVLVPGVPKEQIALLEGARVFSDIDEGEVAPGSSLREAIGFAVIDADGGVMGTVSGVYESPGQGTLVIARPGSVTWVLPAIAPAVRLIDWEAETVELGDFAPYLVEESG